MDKFITERMIELAAVNEYKVDDGSGSVDIKDYSKVGELFSDKLHELAKDGKIGPIVGYFIHKQFRRKTQLILIGEKSVLTVQLQDFTAMKTDDLYKVK